MVKDLPGVTPTPRFGLNLDSTVYSRIAATRTCRSMADAAPLPVQNPAPTGYLQPSVHSRDNLLFTAAQECICIPWKRDTPHLDVLRFILHLCMYIHRYVYRYVCECVYIHI